MNFNILASNSVLFAKNWCSRYSKAIFLGQNFDEKWWKVSHPKLIQNHFGNVPVTPGHQKTSFWIELSFRRPPNKFIKIIILRSRKESQNWPSKWEYWVVVSQRQLDCSFIFLKWLVEQIACSKSNSSHARNFIIFEYYKKVPTLTTLVKFEKSIR